MDLNELRRLVERVGLDRAAVEMGVVRNTLMRVLRGEKVTRGTWGLCEKWAEEAKADAEAKGSVGR